MSTINQPGPRIAGCSPAPWAYEYSPYTLQNGRELPAFEVFDDDGNKLFDSNEDTPEALQEANSRLASAAPSLWAALRECVRLLADHSDSDGEEGDAYRFAVEALELAVSKPSSGV